ncbi:MAG TPA: thioredoxin domain-containing protein [Patescibacteria group bacterium]|nr:thioredoxin domain-containing protein [Patescibacteria group bacterium]
MIDFVKRNLTFIAVVLGTIILLVGGVFLFSGGSTPKTLNENLLIGEKSYQTAPGAPVALVEFGDFQCPACAAYNPLVKQILSEFDGKVNFVFRHYPLPQHNNAYISSYAYEAAGIQRKNLEMADLLYEKQSEWSDATDVKTIFGGYAKILGLNVEKFLSDIDSSAVKDKVASDYADGRAIGINSTPTFYLNGVKIAKVGSLEALRALIQDALNKNPIPEGKDEESYHVHFDLAVFVSGSRIDFSQAKYQESEDNPLDSDIHFHDGNGKVVHVHKKGIPLSRLFDSFNLTLSKGVVSYVNGVKNTDILAYVPVDLDRIVIGGGTDSVSNDACIYSEKCPERGTPPPEECVGGIGTGCEE